MRHAEEIQKFIETLTENTEPIIDDGGMPQAFFFLHLTPEKKYAVTPLHLPEPLMSSSEGKDLLVEQILPTIKNKMKDDGHEIVCICFMSEVWKYAMKKDYVPESGINYREEHEEKYEQCMWTFYMKDKNVQFFRDMIREAGKLVALGEVEVIQNKPEDNNGRFGNLF